MRNGNGNSKDGRVSLHISKKTTDRINRYTQATNQNRTKFVEYCVNTVLDRLERELYSKMTKEELIDILMSNSTGEEIYKVAPEEPQSTGEEIYKAAPEEPQRIEKNDKKISKECVMCGKRFFPSKPFSKYCCESCRVAAMKLNRQKWLSDHPGYYDKYKAKKEESALALLETVK